MQSRDVYRRERIKHSEPCSTPLGTWINQRLWKKWVLEELSLEQERTHLSRRHDQPYRSPRQQSTASLSLWLYLSPATVVSPVESRITVKRDPNLPADTSIRRQYNTEITCREVITIDGSRHHWVTDGIPITTEELLIAFHWSKARVLRDEGIPYSFLPLNGSRPNNTLLRLYNTSLVL